MRYRHIIGSILAIGGLLTVYGCGDSGGDDPAPTAASLTAANVDTAAPKAAGQAVVAIDQLSGMQEVGSLITEQTDFTSPVECPVSGEISLAGSTRASADALTSGDLFKAVFTDCVITLPSGDNLTLNSPEAGPPGMTVLVTSVNGGVNGEPSAPGEAVAFTASFNALDVTNDENLKIDGSLAVAESYSAEVTDATGLVITPEGLRTTVTTDGLTFTELTETGTVDETVAVSGLTIDELEEAETSTETMSISGTVTSSQLGGYMTIDTIIPFVVEDGSDPIEGALRIGFSGGASVTLDAEAAGEPELWIDLNGDGKPELTGQAANPVGTTWGDLRTAAY